MSQIKNKGNTELEETNPGVYIYDNSKNEIYKTESRKEILKTNEPVHYIVKPKFQGNSSSEQKLQYESEETIVNPKLNNKNLFDQQGVSNQSLPEQLSYNYNESNLIQMKHNKQEILSNKNNNFLLNNENIPKMKNHFDKIQINSCNQMSQNNSQNINNQIQNVNNQHLDPIHNNLKLNKKVIIKQEFNQIQLDINNNNMQSNSNNEYIQWGLTNDDIIRNNNEKLNTLKISINEYEENKLINSHYKEIRNDTEYISIGREVHRDKKDEEEGKNYFWYFKNNSLSKLHCVIYKKKDEYFIRAESTSNKSYRYLNKSEKLKLKNGIEFYITLNSKIFNVKVDQTKRNSEPNDQTFKAVLELNIFNQNDEYDNTIEFKCNNYSKYGHLISQFFNEKEILRLNPQDSIKINQPYIYYDDDSKSFVFDRNGFKDNIWLKLVEDASKKEIYDIKIYKGDMYKLASNFILKVDTIE